MAEENHKNLEFEVIQFLLRPIVRFCLRRAHSIQDFMEAAKIVFVDIAAEELKRAEERVNVSRLSVLTGLYRKDVTRIYKEQQTGHSEPQSLSGRVIGQWRHDKRFLNKSGQPRVLGTKGEKSEFRQLVQTVSKNINPGTVLFELERMGSIERTPNGVKLVRQMPGFGSNPSKGFELLSRDIQTLVDAVQENLLAKVRPSNLHIRTEYDNIAKEHLPTIRNWLIDEGKVFHRKTREYLSKFDKDINPELGDSTVGGGRVVVNAFSFTTELPTEPLEK
ncbi:MAG: hypothetical protein KDD66_03810 [Bdellovibrionales bacterium]|nr:hypothetical protein [Bdellovibrionales bacterium]